MISKNIQYQKKAFANCLATFANTPFSNLLIEQTDDLIYATIFSKNIQFYIINYC